MPHPLSRLIAGAVGEAEGPRGFDKSPIFYYNINYIKDNTSWLILEKLYQLL
ncbi:hypothetical protein Holit_00519 [Hollandina sp. SP2]